MILPRKWLIRRPGLLIPVFFLSWCQAGAQLYQHNARTLALGQCYASSAGLASASLNQAGLGRLAESSSSLHHIRPFITPQLDIISLSVQASLNRGAPGMVLTSMGIPGMRQNSAWISYGLRLHPRLYAGLGLHFHFTSIPDEVLFHPALGFAIGLQFMLSEDLILGAHVNHPSAWSKDGPGSSKTLLMTCTGLSYTFFNTASFYTEFHISAGSPVQWCNGIAIDITESLQLFLGMNNRPWSLSAGLALEYRSWGITLAAVCSMDTGISPSTSLSHVW